MSTKDFRAAVTGAIRDWGAASFPSMPIIYENGPIPDEDKIGPIWLDIEIRWYGARPLAMGQVTSGRDSGVISAQVYYRDASGTGLTDDVVDSLRALMKNQRLGGAVVSFPQRTTPSNLKGWYKTGLFFPFTLDT
jgi:hypothetical protein